MSRDICLNCGSEKVKRFRKNNRLLFQCLKCGKVSSRVFTFDDSKLTKTKNGYKHFSVGAIIRKENKVLLIKPWDFPFKYKFPSGHIKKGESPIKAVKRELKEEMGFLPVSWQLLFHEILDWDQCSRGIDIHEWYLFEIKVRGKALTSEEVLDYGWYSARQIKKLKMNKVYQYWLGKIGLIAS